MNRPIDISDLKAPERKFRVIGTDKYDGTRFMIGDFGSKEEAVAKAHPPIIKQFISNIYDDRGNHILQMGML